MAGEVFFRWEVTPRYAWGEGLNRYTEAVNAAVYTLMLARVPEIETWMKDNAVWVDRTGNARQSLWSEVYQFIDLIVVVLSHGVEYGQYLEIVSAGYFSIITPALDHWGPVLMNDVRGLLA